MEPNVIDFGPLVEPILLVLGTVLTALAGFVIRWVAKKIGVENTAIETAVTGQVEQLLNRATDYGIKKIRDTRVAEVRTESELLGVAASYALKMGPGVLAKIGISDRAEDQIKLLNMIEARLPGKGEWIAVDVDGDGIPDKTVRREGAS